CIPAAIGLISIFSTWGAPLKVSFAVIRVDANENPFFFIVIILGFLVVDTIVYSPVTVSYINEPGLFVTASFTLIVTPFVSPSGVFILPFLRATCSGLAFKYRPNWNKSYPPTLRPLVRLGSFEQKYPVLPSVLTKKPRSSPALFMG